MAMPDPLAYEIRRLATLIGRALDAAPERVASRHGRDLAVVATSAILATILLRAARDRPPEPLPVARTR